MTFHYIFELVCSQSLFCQSTVHTSAFKKPVSYGLLLSRTAVLNLWSNSVLVKVSSLDSGGVKGVLTTACQTK